MILKRDSAFEAVVQGAAGATDETRVVYRREDGIWRMAHVHSSIGVPNADAIGVELPADPARGADTAEPTSAQRRTQPFHGHVAMIRKGPRKR